MQPGENVLRINEAALLEPGVAEVFGRCLTGEVWVGWTVHLTDETYEVVSGPLTVEGIWLGPQVPVTMLSQMYQGLLRLVGEVDRISSARWMVGAPRASVEES